MLISQSQSSTHRALACCDILEELFQHLQAGADSESRLTLSRLARVWRTFNAFFTRKLWATLPSIDPLLRILSALQVVETEQLAEEYVLTRPIKSDEWSRCLYLASFVRCIEGASSRPAVSSVWLYIAMLLGEKPLLPSVRELYWEVVSSTSAELALLVSPSLRHLSLTFKDFDQYQDHWTTGLLALLRNIVPRATNLSELHLYDLQTDDLSSVISPVGSLHQLTTLEVRDAIVDLPVLETLSRMTSLSDLTLLIELGDNSDPKFCGFPSLKRINITNSVSAGEIIKVLATFRSKTVIDFAFNNGGGSWSSQQLLAVCRALTKRCPMLERLAATICMPGSDDLAATIAPLNGLRSLRDVELKLTGRLGAPMKYADPLFLMLAASWPCIVSLRLLSDYSDGHVSPLILLAFANACPDLRELCIPILDLPLDMVMGDVSTFPLRDHGLKIMRVQFPSEEIDDDKIFALILDRLFPNIDIDASLAPVPALHSGEWDRVLDEALKYCQLVRRNREPETDANKT